MYKWYENHILTALIPGTIILYLQIPHTLAAADCFLLLGWDIVHYHPVLDFFLYGIDLLEIVPILGNTTVIYTLILKKRRERRKR